MRESSCDSTFDHSVFETTTEVNERFELFEDPIQNRVVELLKKYSEQIVGVNEKIDKLKNNVYDQISEIHRSMEREKNTQVVGAGKELLEKQGEEEGKELLEKQLKEEVKAGEAAINKKITTFDKTLEDELSEIHTNLRRLEEQRNYWTTYAYNDLNDRMRHLERQQRNLKTNEKYE